MSANVPWGLALSSLTIIMHITYPKQTVMRETMRYASLSSNSRHFSVAGEWRRDAGSDVINNKTKQVKIQRPAREPRTWVPRRSSLDVSILGETERVSLQFPSQQAVKVRNTTLEGTIDRALGTTYSRDPNHWGQCWPLPIGHLHRSAHPSDEAVPPSKCPASALQRAPSRMEREPHCAGSHFTLTIRTVR